MCMFFVPSADSCHCFIRRYKVIPRITYCKAIWRILHEKEGLLDEIQKLDVLINNIIHGTVRHVCEIRHVYVFGRLKDLFRLDLEIVIDIDCNGIDDIVTVAINEQRGVVLHSPQRHPRNRLGCRRSPHPQSQFLLR